MDMTWWPRQAAFLAEIRESAFTAGKDGLEDSVGHVCSSPWTTSGSSCRRTAAAAPMLTAALMARRKRRAEEAALVVEHGRMEAEWCGGCGPTAAAAPMLTALLPRTARRKRRAEEAAFRVEHGRMEVGGLAAAGLGESSLGFYQWASQERRRVREEDWPKSFRTWPTSHPSRGRLVHGQGFLG